MPAEPTDLHALLGRARGRAVLIVGDLMLDHFVIGRVDRISPEAPVPVVQFDHESYRLGGAANVAHNVAALGGSVEIAGLVGNDAEGTRLLADLRRVGVGTSAVIADRDRCTTRKLRVVTTRNQQVARIDYECDRAVDGDLEATLAKKIRDAAARADVVLVSDYQKGTITEVTAQAAIDAAKAQGRAVARRPEGPAHRLLRGGVAHHAEPPRGGSGHAATDPEHRRGAIGGPAFPRAREMRQRAHHARRARHVAARDRRGVRPARGGARGLGRDGRRGHGDRRHRVGPGGRRLAARCRPPREPRRGTRGRTLRAGGDHRRRTRRGAAKNSSHGLHGNTSTK